MTDRVDAVVIGAGPNGLVAAIEIARTGRSVVVVEQAAVAGGGMRSEELTLPGVHHDVCSSVHPLGLASPAMRDLPLEAHGVRWIQPDAPLAHPLDGGAAVLERDLDATAERLGADGDAWRRTFGLVTGPGIGLVDDLLDPISVPRHPFAMARFGLTGVRGSAAVGSRFASEEARALLAGLAGHSIQRLDAPATAAYAMLLGGLGHLVGWPLVDGGSQRLADALVSILESHGGRVERGVRVEHERELPSSRVVLADLTPRQTLGIVGDRIPGRARRRYERFRHGPGVFKVDWALDGPVPWADAEVARAATVHVGGTAAEIQAAEAEVARGGHPDRPFVLVVQPSAFDPSRAPAGVHVLWAYCHVPNGSRVDVTDRIESQIERFAPGFRERILAKHTMDTAAVEAHGPNYLGGDINGGSADVWQYVTRPVVSPWPWRVPVSGQGPAWYLCSSSIPPGGGVHGMCGRRAARSALARELRDGLVGRPDT